MDRCEQPHCSYPTIACHAALSDTPSIKSLTGGAATATLRFLKPASATDQDTITYRVQVGGRTWLLRRGCTVALP